MIIIDLIKRILAFGIFSFLLVAVVNTNQLAAIDFSSDERYFVEKTANLIIKSADYLPLTSISDGCYARAFYIGMELAIRGIASNNLYIIGNLHPQGARWKWHVAPALKLPSHASAIVFDPALSSAPLTGLEWVELTNPQSKPLFHVAPVSNYKNGLSLPKNRNKQRDFGYSKRKLVIEFDELPRFEISDIAHACKTIWNHIGLEKIPERMKRQKRSKLERRTTYLIQKLMEVDKLTFKARVINCGEGTYHNVFAAK